MTKSVTIAIEDPGTPDVAGVIAEADTYYATQYEEAENLLLPVATLQTPDITFWVARVDGAVAGTIALMHDPRDASEVKRLYVREGQRGLGIAVGLVDALHTRARALKIPLLKLETGDKQLAAIELYARLGYRRCGVYADYPDNPGHVFMEIRL